MLYQLNYSYYPNRNKGIDLFVASIIIIPLMRFLAITSLRDWLTLYNLYAATFPRKKNFILPILFF